MQDIIFFGQVCITMIIGALLCVSCCRVQTASKNYAVQMSRRFQQKFPPILACNPLLQAVAENLISSSEVEESSDDEATSGRKRIRSRRILDDDP